MMRTIKLNILAALLLFLLTNVSQAQPASTEKQSLIQEYFEITGGRQLMNEILDATYAELDNTMSTLMKTTIEQSSDLSASQKAELQKDMPGAVARLNKKFRDELKKELDFAKVIEEVNYQLLDKYFTESELKDLIAFYQTPTGQKVISVQPKLHKDASAKLNAVLMPAIQRVIRRTTSNEIDEMIEKIKDDN